ncbi:MAG: multicopper oxidase domain-containing protein [Alicyclobacillus sp.]|nr:multicopper oxidase domain-containing protein [Alicyclobacillus sp.]
MNTHRCTDTHARNKGRRTQLASAGKVGLRTQRSGVAALSAVALVTVLAGCGAAGSTSAPNAQAVGRATGGSANEVPMNGMGQAGNRANQMPSSMPGQGLNQTPRPMQVVRRGHDVSITMYTEETRVEIAPGVSFPAWTFDGTVPGPVIQLEQGDHVQLTLHNLDPHMSHSIDLHAALVAPNQNYVDVPPGGTRTITFDATVPGVFLYHCETQPMALHIAQGMYGAVVVTPKGQQPPQFTIVQSEFYKPLDLDDVENGTPQYVVFNGEANRYMLHPLHVRAGQTISVAFVDAGPNDWSAFHVVGSILREVEASGNPANRLTDVQTASVAPGDGILLTLRFPQPGTYTFTTHSMRDAAKGAMGSFVVTP